MHANKMQKSMVDIQPRMKELQEKYKDDPQKLWEETMKLMKSGWAWGGLLTGCKMMLIQMPVFLWMFYVIRNFSMNHEDKADIYSFLYPYIHTGIDHIQSVFLWMDLLKPVNTLWLWWIILTLLAWFLMYLQIKITTLNKPKTPSIPAGMPGMPKMPDMWKMMWFMNTFMIVMMMLFVYTMPAGIGLYIVTTTLFTVVQYAIQYRELLKVEFMILTSKKSKDLATK
jgi:YidC/Oxa1 family membrane protein insertase